MPAATATLRACARVGYDPLQAVRTHAQVHCDALLAGDIGKAAEEMSKELRSNLGSIVGMLPLPLTEATIESIE